MKSCVVGLGSLDRAMLIQYLGKRQEEREKERESEGEGIMIRIDVCWSLDFYIYVAVRYRRAIIDEMTSSIGSK